MQFAPLKFDVIYIFIILTDNNKQWQNKFVELRVLSSSSSSTSSVVLFVDVKLQLTRENEMTPVIFNCNLCACVFFFVYNAMNQNVRMKFNAAEYTGGTWEAAAAKKWRWSVRVRRARSERKCACFCHWVVFLSHLINMVWLRISMKFGVPHPVDSSI